MKEKNTKTKLTKNNFFSKMSIYIPVILSFLFLLYSRTITQPIVVVGDSMLPTYKSGQLLLADRKYENIERFDVIAVKAEGKYIIKRVIGLPGETVEITKEEIKINGKVLENDAHAVLLDNIGEYFSVTLGENEYYVLGDNRNNSNDSRYYGAFNTEQILGKIREK